MREVTGQNFGLLIAYILPGFIVLWGLSHVSTTIAGWLGSTADDPTVGGFLYVTLASVGAGLTVSTLRWLLIDSLHHHTGLQQPAWDFSRLADRTAAFDVLIEIHYRYYQAYANTVIGLPLAFSIRWAVHGFDSWEALLVLSVGLLFLAASRDTLQKYYQRVEGMLGRSPEPLPATTSSDADAAQQIGHSDAVHPTELR